MSSRRRSLRGGTGTPQKGAEKSADDTAAVAELTPRNILTRKKRVAVASALAESSDSRPTTPATGKGRRLSTTSTTVATDSPAPQVGPDTPVRRSKRLSESLPMAVTAAGQNAAEEAAAVATPRKSRRLSETLSVPEVTASPQRSRKKVDESAAAIKPAEHEEESATSVKDGATPRKNARRTSISAVANDAPAVATPPRHRKISELAAGETARPGTPPVRKSRRLSGGSIEEMTSALPLTPTRKSRRLSGCVVDIPAAIEEAKEEEIAVVEAAVEPKVDAAMEPIAEGSEEDTNRPEVANMETIAEEEEEEAETTTVGAIVETEEVKENTREGPEMMEKKQGGKDVPIPVPVAVEAVEETQETVKGDERVEDVEASSAKDETAMEVTEDKSASIQPEGASSASAGEEVRSHLESETGTKSSELVNVALENTAAGLSPEVSEGESAESSERIVVNDGSELDVPTVVVSKLESSNSSCIPKAMGMLQEPSADSSNKENKKSGGEEKCPVDPLEALQRLMLPQVPRQKPKSGKFWKADRNQFRAIRKDKGPRKTFEQRLKAKEEIQRSKELASMLLQAKVEQKQELRRRIEENRKRKEEREKKAEVFQIVRNPNKIKKLKRKDLVKRDILGKVQPA